MAENPTTSPGVVDARRLALRVAGEHAKVGQAVLQGFRVMSLLVEAANRLAEGDRVVDRSGGRHAALRAGRSDRHAQRAVGDAVARTGRRRVQVARRVVDHAGVDRGHHRASAGHPGDGDGVGRAGGADRRDRGRKRAAAVLPLRSTSLPVKLVTAALKVTGEVDGRIVRWRSACPAAGTMVTVGPTVS